MVLSSRLSLLSPFPAPLPFCHQPNRRRVRSPALLLLRLPSPSLPVSLLFSSSSSLPTPIPHKTSLAAAWQPPNYVYPDPIPEFAAAESQRFRKELLKKISKDKETFGDETDTIVMVCTEIFSDFLHKEYGGPGTLLVEPFTDMLLALKEKKLPGAPVAARAALLWSQSYVDRDWEIWNSQPPK